METKRKTRWVQLLEEQLIRPARPPAGKRMRKLGPILAGTGLVTATSLLSIWVHVQTINLRYRVSQAYEENRRLLERQSSLEIERQMLRSPQRITRIAEQDLGMCLPDLRARTIVK
ncbi:MAG: cell division protein FtsL [bacterium]